MMLELIAPLLGVFGIFASGQARPPTCLRLALTPSQSPTSLQDPGEEFAQALTRLLGIPVKVYIASDYASVIEALRSRNVDLAFVHPVGTC
jgi:phosphonate transport system substrate-binding protein